MFSRLDTPDLKLGFNVATQHLASLDCFACMMSAAQVAEIFQEKLQARFESKNCPLKD